MKSAEILFAGAILLGVSSIASAAVVTWDFSNAESAGSSAGSTSVAPSAGTPVANLTVSDFSGSSSVAKGAFSNSTSNYTGASGGNNFGMYVVPGGSEYYFLTLTPASGFAVQISDLDFATRSTSTGPQAFAIQTSIDNYGSDIATGSIANDSTWNFKNSSFPSVTGTIDEVVTVRIVLSSGSGGTGSAANNRIDDVVIDVAAVPEPGSLALVALGGMMALRRRRQA